MKTRLMTFCALSFAVLLATGGPQAQAGPDDVAAAAEALLDDPDARAKMSAMLELRLLTLSGRIHGAVRRRGRCATGGGGIETLLSASDILVNDPGSDFGSFDHSERDQPPRQSDHGDDLLEPTTTRSTIAVGGTSFSGFSRSTDGGATFVDRGGIPPGWGWQELW